MKRTATAAEKRHMARISGMGCIVCELCFNAQGTPAQVHHVQVNHGWGRSGHMNTILLYGYSELELLAIVNERIQKK